MPDHSELLERIYLLHRRLRFRSPAGVAERAEWAEVVTELRRMFESKETEEGKSAN